jgi:hypothetical protein
LTEGLAAILRDARKPNGKGNEHYTTQHVPDAWAVPEGKPTDASEQRYQQPNKDSDQLSAGTLAFRHE